MELATERSTHDSHVGAQLQSAIRGERTVDANRPTTKTSLLVLSLLVLVGAVLRLDFMRAVGFCIDGDEAIVGLMGKHILEGRGVPVFYYGQHYMGSLEAVLASISFSLFGVSSFSLQLVPLICSLLLIVLMFCLGCAVMNTRAGLVAAALMAVAPPGLLVWSSKARGGFIELVVIGALAMLVCIAWIRTHPERLRYPLALGFILGIGWWVNNQIVYFIAPIGVFSLIHTFSQSMRLAGNGTAGGTTLGMSGGVVRVAVCGLAAFIAGSAAYWFYNIQRGFPSAGMYRVVDVNEFVHHLRGLFYVALPMIVGAQRFWQKSPLFPGAKELALVMYLIPILLLVALRWRAVLGLARGSIDRQKPVELLVLFSIACCGIFAISSFGGLVQAPRYLLPMYIGIYALVAICCELVMARSFKLGLGYLVLLLAFQLSASYLGGRGIAGEPVVYASDRVARDHKPLIEVLRSMGITHVRTNYWIGYRLAFETKEEITFSQIGEPLQVRMPEYEEFPRAERERWPLVLVRAQVPAVTSALKRMGYSFSQTRAGEYTIVHDLVQPMELPQSLKLERQGVSIQASGVRDPWLALDGNHETRWGTGEPQAPGQTFVIEWQDPVFVEGIGVYFDQWWPDRPRELKIEVEDVDGSRSVVLSPFEAKGAFEVSINDGGFVVRTQRALVKRVILTQLGRDSVFDWSIGELAVFGQQRRRSS
jgi:4-amino-4-deoxy-L-arabinose transferase-like glycosyltransferase